MSTLTRKTSKSSTDSISDESASGDSSNSAHGENVEDDAIVAAGRQHLSPPSELTSRRSSREIVVRGSFEAPRPGEDHPLPPPFARDVKIDGWKMVGGKTWTDKAKLGSYVVYEIDIALQSVRSPATGRMGH
jgi:hypothetical protein